MAVPRYQSELPGTGLEPVEGLKEVNLLSNYEDPQHNNQVDFWMEPGETYYLGTPLVLPAGMYLAKVTVVGSDDDGDYWTRVLRVLIPTQPVEALDPHAG